MNPLHLDSQLIARVDAAEFSFTRGRMNVIRDLRNDPDCIAFIEDKGLLAVLAPKIPNPYFNRLFLSAPTDVSGIRSTLAAAKEKGTAISIEVSPGAITQEIGKELSQASYFQSNFHPIFLKKAIDLTPPTNALQTRLVSTMQDLAAFKKLYVQGWELHADFGPVMESFIEKWIDIPGWRLYLAFAGHQAISCAVLYMHDGMAYLADATTPPAERRRGGQSALLNTRICDGIKLNAQYIWSRADFGSVSQKNMEKAGLNISYTRSVWTQN